MNNRQDNISNDLSTQLRILYHTCPSQYMFLNNLTLHSLSASVNVPKTMKNDGLCPSTPVALGYDEEGRRIFSSQGFLEGDTLRPPYLFHVQSSTVCNIQLFPLNSRYSLAQVFISLFSTPFLHALLLKFQLGSHNT